MATPLEPKRTSCLKGHESPKLDIILECFSIKQSNILCMFVMGSHLWNSCTKKSDWDLVIIMDSKSLSHAVNAHKRNIDAWIVPEDEYNTYIIEHLIQALLTLWVPDTLVILKKPTFNPSGKFRFSANAMRVAIEKLYARDTRVAAKHFSKCDSTGGLKIVKHLLRQLELSQQIIVSRSIIDYTIQLNCLADTNTSWNDIETMLLTKKTSVLDSIP